MTKTMGYPTWVRVNARHWESEEQMDGTPDFVALRKPDGWHLKWRSSAQGWSGFRRLRDVHDFVAEEFGRK